MKLKCILAVFCVLAFAALIIAPAAAAEDSLKDNIIHVSGYGESVTDPDKVTINIGVNIISDDAAKAQKEAAEKMDAVVAALKSAGIKENNLKTSQYSMYSHIIGDYEKSEYKVGTTVYEVTNTVEAVSYDVKSVGTIIDKAVKAGANKVNSLQFGLSNEKQIQQRNAAIISAVKAARADADAVAGALGISIKGTGVINVDQSYRAVNYAPSPVVMKAADTAAGATPIAAGELSTTATVSIVYTY